VDGWRVGATVPGSEDFVTNFFQFANLWKSCEIMQSRWALGESGRRAIFRSRDPEKFVTRPENIGIEVHATSNSSQKRRTI
jgi:hypothetical protein